MNAVAARPKTGFKFMLIVKGGPDKGTSYQLLPPKVTIGRDATNHIPLNDPRVSRQAAIIEFSMERIVITDTSSRKILSVDGNPTSQAELVDGSVIRIGDSQLIFAVEAMQLNAPGGFSVNAQRSPSSPLQMVPPNDQAPYTGPDQAPASTGDAAVSRRAPGAPPHAADQQNYAPRVAPRSSAQAQNPTFKIIIGLLIAGALYVGLAENIKKKAGHGITTSTDIQKEIDSSEQLQEVIKKQRKFSSDEEKTRYEEANRHYLEGFRDYQNAQYSRALRSFETALAIDPANELARRYYSLAQKQRDDMVASLILEGRMYKDKQMYTRCSSALEKALDFMSNKDDLKYKQTESMMKECDLRADPRN